jgi:hypothetical protein
MLAGVGLAAAKSAMQLAIEVVIHMPDPQRRPAVLHGCLTHLPLCSQHGKRRFLVRAEMDSRDDVYRWMMHWLAQHPDFADLRSFSVTTSLKKFGASGARPRRRRGDVAKTAGGKQVRGRHRAAWTAAHDAHAGRMHLRMLSEHACTRNRTTHAGCTASTACTR